MTVENTVTMRRAAEGRAGREASATDGAEVRPEREAGGGGRGRGHEGFSTMETVL